MVTLADIYAARERIQDTILRTPAIEDPTGSGLCIKAEHLQRTGSFKLRGAANCVKRAVEEGVNHVVTGSSGNHGQAVAYMARRLGIKATVVVPEDASHAKIRGIQAYGATIEFCGLTSAERLERAAEIARIDGAVFVPPYDNPYVIAGQGTTGLEILEQVPDAEVVYVPVGGGGLIAGIATAIKELKPRVKVIGVEPALAADTYLSRQQGKMVSIGPTNTLADGLRASQPGSLTFPIIQRYVDDLVLVSEAEIRQAGRYLLERMKQAVEPSGAVSFAAAWRTGAKAVALISGGNLDLGGLAGVPAWMLTE